MKIPYLAIDSNYEALEDNEVTAEVIDSYIQMTSMNLLNVDKRYEHVLELITHKMNYWYRLIDSADELIWIKSKGYGWVIYWQNEACGFIRLYRIKPSKDTDHFRDTPWDRGAWKTISSDRELENIVDTPEARFIFSSWKNHQLSVNKLSTEFANGRLDNTSVEQVMIISKGNGCVICGDYATHRAATSMGGESAVMLNISLCKVHEYDAQEHPCVLTFFGSLFFIKLEIPDLIKLDHVPDELIEPIFSVIASHLDAEYSEPKKIDSGWKVRFVMDDGWYWLLRMKNLKSYAYMLFNDSKVQLHRIDSAPDHPDVPFGPDHQHIMPGRKNHKVEPSFTYGVPLFDFPLLQKAKAKYKDML